MTLANKINERFELKLNSHNYYNRIVLRQTDLEQDIQAEDAYNNGLEDLMHADNKSVVEEELGRETELNSLWSVETARNVFGEVLLVMKSVCSGYEGMNDSARENVKKMVCDVGKIYDKFADKTNFQKLDLTLETNEHDEDNEASTEGLDEDEYMIEDSYENVEEGDRSFEENETEKSDDHLLDESGIEDEISDEVSDIEYL